MKWVRYPHAFCIKKGVELRAAAIHLLIAGWKGEMAAYGSPDEPFHYVTAEGLLSANELKIAAEIFWKAHCEALGPTEIIQNIKLNSSTVL
jgi:hypothetical protein